MAGVYERAADELRRNGRHKDARFMERLAGVYAANALLNSAARRAEEESEGMPAAA
jgi:hypothetical protein